MVVVVVVVVKGQRFRKLNVYWHARGDRSSVQQRNPSPGVFWTFDESYAKCARGIIATRLSIISRIDASLRRSFLFTYSKNILTRCRITISNARISLSFFYVGVCIICEVGIGSLTKKKYCCINHLLLCIIFTKIRIFR